MTSFAGVVVNYRTPDDLDRFIRSWVANPPSCDWTLLIVDVAALEARDSPDLRILTMCIAENIGYGKACNLAANILGPKFDYLAFFNADVEVLPGSLDGCIGALELNPTWAVVGPRQVDRLGRFTHAGILGTQLAPRHRGWRERDKGQYRDVLDDVPTVSGAAYFIRSTVWWEMTKCPIFQSSAPRALGAFLPTKHYWNETYLSHHVIEHGHKVVYLGSVGMIHQWHQASPMGGWGEIHMKEDQTFFRQACEDHGILHD